MMRTWVAAALALTSGCSAVCGGPGSKCGDDVCPAVADEADWRDGGGHEGLPTTFVDAVDARLGTVDAVVGGWAVTWTCPDGAVEGSVTVARTAQDVDVIAHEDDPVGGIETCGAYGRSEVDLAVAAGERTVRSATAELVLGPTDTSFVTISTDEVTVVIDADGAPSGTWTDGEVTCTFDGWTSAGS